MAEYLIQDTTLTGIADKIRPLLGLTGTMTPEQMQTNLTTEQANITAALAALAEKGVEVPEGANSNALAGLIAAIEAGGGLDSSIESSFMRVLSGSFVLADTGTKKIFQDVFLREFGISTTQGNSSDSFGICFCTEDPKNSTGYLVIPSYSGGKFAYQTETKNGSISGYNSSNDLITTNGKLNWTIWSALGGVTYYWVLFLCRKSGEDV